MQNGAVRGVIANIVNVLDIVIDKEHVFFGGTLDYTKTVSYYENGEIKRKIKLCCFAIVTQLARPPAQKDGRSLVVSRNYRGHIVLK